MIKPYIFFNGNCEEAFQLYAKAFDGEIIHMQKYGEMPQNIDFPISEEEKNLVLHAQVSLNEGGVLMGADVARPLEKGTNINFSLEMTSEEAAKKSMEPSERRRSGADGTGALIFCQITRFSPR